MVELYTGGKGQQSLIKMTEADYKGINNKLESLRKENKELKDKIEMLEKPTQGCKLAGTITGQNKLYDFEDCYSKEVDVKVTVVKPPLGLIPKNIHRYQRRIAIIEAMDRYLQANKEIPIEWLEEYNELI